MILRKKIIAATIYYIILCPLAFAGSPKIPSRDTCQAIFLDFNINPDIKSSKGWKRVKFKNSIKQYIINSDKIDDETLTLIIDCLILNSSDLNILNHTIGGQNQ